MPLKGYQIYLFFIFLQIDHNILKINYFLMSMKKTWITAAFILIFAQYYLILSQVNFSRTNDTYLKDQNFRSGIPIAMADLNGDMLTDMVIISNNNQLFASYNRGPERRFDNQLISGLPNGNQYALLIGDLNNNGQMEILSGGLYNGFSVFRINNSGLYELWYRTPADVFTQASNLIDVNNDGFLDLFVCHDDGPSKIYINNGEGRLIEQNIIDFTTTPSSDDSGNYGSEWVDVNNDGLPDLYIAKCRSGANSPLDPRRINMLFINYGNGVFVNEALERGVASGAQSWTASFADLDNDGDMDLIITNHHNPHQILINDGNGYFSEIETSHLGLDNFSVQSIMRDFDNNGFVDVYISGVDRDILIYNYGNLEFESLERPLSSVTVNSAVAGDINDDGFEDIFASHSRFLNLTGFTDDAIWLNKGNGNNWLKLFFEGTQSNRQGIGSRVDIFGDWGMQTRELKAGESYGIFNPGYVHFGLGPYNHIDSMIITWPSGQVDRYFELNASEIFLAQEARCITSRVHIPVENDGFFCLGEQITLSAPSGFQDYLWNNHTQSMEAEFTAPDMAVATMTDSSGCKTISYPVFLDVLDNQVKLIKAPDALYICEADFPTVEANIGYATYEWSDGTESFSFNPASPGRFHLTAYDACGDEIHDSIYITSLERPGISTIGASVLTGESAELQAIGQNIRWFENIDDPEPIAFGNILQILNPTESKNYYAEANLRIENDVRYTGMFRLNESPQANSNNSGLIFSCQREFLLKSFSVRSFLPGIRRFLVLNSSGEILASHQQFVDSGIGVIHVNWLIPTGERHLITTDESVNLEELNSPHPRLARSNFGVNFPYEIPGLLSIEQSTNGTQLYFYFYEWEIAADIQECSSERIPAFLEVETSSTFTPDSEEKIMVIPNPATNFFEIRALSPDVNYEIEIFSMNGQLFRKDFCTEACLQDISSLPQGMYLLRILNTETQKSQHCKLIKLGQ
jgi:hypothetical protein